MSPSARLAESSNKTKCASYGLHVFGQCEGMRCLKETVEVLGGG